MNIGENTNLNEDMIVAVVIVSNEENLFCNQSSFSGFFISFSLFSTDVIDINRIDG